MTEMTPPRPSLYYHHADEWFTKGRSSGGSFVDRMFDLLGTADGENLEKLRRAFPDLVGAWTHRQRCAVLVQVPHSEAAMHLRIAGQWRWVAPRPNGMAQVLSPDGSPFSAPITRGEAGIPYNAEDEEDGRGVE